MKSIRLLFILIFTFGIITNVLGDNQNIPSKAEYIKNATPLEDGGIFDFYTDGENGELFLDSLNTRYEDADTIYEIIGNTCNLSTKRKGSWSFSGKLELILSSHKLVTSGFHITDPIAWKRYTQCIYSQGKVFGTNTQTRTSFNNHILGNYANNKLPKTELFIRITRDHQSDFFFSEYSLDGRKWQFGGSCYLDISGDEAIYTLSCWSPEAPGHVIASNVEMSPAIPYTIRNVSKYQYLYGDLIHVSLKVKNPGNKTTHIEIKETPPVQWNISDIADDGQYKDGIIRWSFDMPPGEKHLDYTIAPPPDTVLIPQFKGKINTSEIMGINQLFKSRLDPSKFIFSLVKYSSSLAIVLILLIMHLCMFIFYPQWKENLGFSIYLSCIIGFIILVGAGELFSNNHFQYVVRTRLIFFILWSIASTALLSFFNLLSLPELPKRFWIFAVLWCIFLFWMFVISNSFLPEKLAIYLNLSIFIILNVIVLIECLITITKGIRAKRDGILIIAFGSFILLSGALYAIVYMYSKIFNWASFAAFFRLFYLGNTFLGITVLLFLISISISISYRFARSVGGLKTLNLELEDRVAHRTAELEQANHELRELDKMKTQFVSQASHDLRTPLTAIKGSLDNLLMGIAGALNEKQQKVMTRATTSVDRLTNLINDVLDLNRIETGRIVLEKSDIPFKALVENIINENQPAADQKQITLTANLGEEVNLHIDGSKIERVVGELISNAIKYTPDCGTVDVGLSLEDNVVSLTVKDSGIGMTAEECKKIWERFYRTSASQKFAKGSGLGLSIAKELVELHGGTLTVESKKGEGTTFTLII